MNFKKKIFFNIANFYFFFSLNQLKAMKYYSVINKNCSVKEKPLLFMCCLFLWNYLNNISKILFPHSNLLSFHSFISLLPFYFSPLMAHKSIFLVALGKWYGGGEQMLLCYFCYWFASREAALNWLGLGIPKWGGRK